MTTPMSLNPPLEPDIKFTYEETKDIVESIVWIMFDYVYNNVYHYPDMDFELSFLNDIDEYINELIYNVTGEKETLFGIPTIVSRYRQSLEYVVNYSIQLFHSISPIRSFSDSVILQKMNKEMRDEKTKIIDILRKKPQPEQRTKEWYDMRNNLITASNAYKIFESGAMQNQLIYEKCSAFHKIPEKIDESLFKNINVDTTLHWGQKYEKVSVMLYEYIYKTSVEEFGCIRHDKYSFIGASPDGINVDPESDRYGRMLEIKNIVNREITGIPKPEYWVQMQLQMETCNLEECDFLETRFKEYENEREFLSDGSFLFDSNNNHKGVILFFSHKNGTPHYIYKPIEMDKEDFDEWEMNMMEFYQSPSQNLVWIRNVYWRLDQLSCVLVSRNQFWFDMVVVDVEKFWNTIEKERIDGYTHRAPKKRIKQPKEENHTFLYSHGKEAEFKL